MPGRHGVIVRVFFAPTARHSASVLTMRVTTARIDPELRPRLDRYARETRRSLTGMINVLVREGLDRLDREHTKN